MELDLQSADIIAAREAMEQQYAPSIAAFEREAQPEVDEIRESRHITGDDLSITINQ
jgi:hypothetical protein